MSSRSVIIMSLIVELFSLCGKQSEKIIKISVSVNLHRSKNLFMNFRGHKVC